MPGVACKEVERASQSKEQHLWIIRRGVLVLYAEITPGEEVGKSLDVRGAKNFTTEGTDHRGTDRVGIAQNEGFDPSVKVGIGYGDDRLAVIIAGLMQACHLSTPE